MCSVNSNLIKINPFIWFGLSLMKGDKTKKNKNKETKTKQKTKTGELDERACMNSVR